MNLTEFGLEIDSEIEEMERNGLIEVDRSDPSNPLVSITDVGLQALHEWASA